MDISSSAGDERALDVWQLRSWAEQEEDPNCTENSFIGKPNHSTPPYTIDYAINAKICIW